jgi:hypothetical protein
MLCYDHDKKLNYIYNVDVCYFRDSIHSDETTTNNNNETKCKEPILLIQPAMCCFHPEV